MIQCKDCEYFHKSEDGEISFRCDPFGTIKEPECLAKWQFIKMNQLVQSYQATLSFYQRFAPMQEKMFKVVERELEDMDEAEQWKQPEDENDENDKNDDDDDFEFPEDRHPADMW